MPNDDSMEKKQANLKSTNDVINDNCKSTIEQSTDYSLTTTPKYHLVERLLTTLSQDSIRKKQLEDVLRSVLQDSDTTSNETKSFTAGGVKQEMNEPMSVSLSPSSNSSTSLSNMSMPLEGLRQFAKLIIDAGGTHQMTVSSLTKSLTSRGFRDSDTTKIVQFINGLIYYGLIIIPNSSSVPSVPTNNRLSRETQLPSGSPPHRSHRHHSTRSSSNYSPHTNHRYVHHNPG